MTTPRIVRAPGVDEIAAAEKAADVVHRYIEGPGISQDAALGAYVSLAVAASIDALRAALTGELTGVAEQLAEIEQRLAAIDT